jgi:hypothetical protein
MKMKSPRRFNPPTGRPHHLIFALFILLLFFVIPNAETQADSNAPTITNTPEPTDTPIPEPPTETPAATAEPTWTPLAILPTEIDDNIGAISIATPPASNGGGLSTLNRILLVTLGVAVVVVVGVIVYIFINQTRSGLGER